MAKIPIFVEKGFVVSGLLISTGASLTFWRGNDPGQTGRMTDPLLQAIWFGIYAITLLLMLALHKQAIKAMGRDKLSWVLLGIAVCSTLWSDLPEITLRRGIALAGTNIFGIYLATRYSLKEQLRLLAWALGIAAILSLLIAIAIPSYGIAGTGAWRGIYGQKNVLARIMVLSTMVFLLLALSIHKHRWVAWAMFCLSTGLVVLSTSKTSLVSLATLLILFLLYRPLRLHYTRAIPLSIFSILIMGSAANWLATNAENLLQSLGKDVTLTGRTDLWAAVFEMIWKRPILGYGYGGFWTSGWDGPAAYVWSVTNWQPSHSHNGILNLWLDLGLLGVVVFVCGYLMLTIRTLSWIRLTKTAEGFWPLLYMTFLFMFNQTESTILVQNGIFWILYVALSFSRPTEQVNPQKVAHLSPQKQRLSENMPPS